jgi:hypothetical protein
MQMEPTVENKLQEAAPEEEFDLAKLWRVEGKYQPLVVILSKIGLRNLKKWDISDMLIGVFGVGFMPALILALTLFPLGYAVSRAIVQKSVARIEEIQAPLFSFDVDRPGFSQTGASIQSDDYLTQTYLNQQAVILDVYVVFWDQAQILMAQAQDTPALLNDPTWQNQMGALLPLMAEQNQLIRQMAPSTAMLSVHSDLMSFAYHSDRFIELAERGIAGSDWTQIALAMQDLALADYYFDQSFIEGRSYAGE